MTNQAKNKLRSYCATLLFLCTFAIIAKGQCDQLYNWTEWTRFSGNSAEGTINLNGQSVSVEMTANYTFDSTPRIFRYNNFNGFSPNSPIPNATIPRTTWSVGTGGVTEMCFSEVVSNPVLVFASLGAPSTPVTLELSLPYEVIFDGGGMDFINDRTIYGAEGYAVLLFPGNFECVTIYSNTPEFYTNITWGLNPPLFPVTISGDSIVCDSTILTVSGGSTYLWDGGTSPNSSVNTFFETGNYFLTVTDALGCSVVTSVNVLVDNTICRDCNGVLNGTAVLDDCGLCLEPNDPNFNQSCLDCNGVINGLAEVDECGECWEPTDPNFNQSCADCSGTPNGLAVIDICGECLEPSDPNFNQSCFDCNGVMNGTAVIDECGDCLEPNDPNFNQACVDCSGVPNGLAIIDDCGECWEPTDPNFNQACADCNGTPYGPAIIDDCGACFAPSDPNFNQSCLDCNGILNGSAEFDECGVCLEPTDSSFNQSCADCNGIPNGPAIIDDCGDCFAPSDSAFNQSCADCKGIPNGLAVIDKCGECLDPNDLDFNQSCAEDIFVPNIFTPNHDGRNDRFQVFKKTAIKAKIQTFRIYSRWGELIYEANDFEFNEHANWWDGTFKNEDIQTGVYLYYFKLNYQNGKILEYMGDVTVMR
ncbi:MAG: gliding motility-associated C-terminal domain-containing protein [Bacteroidota bacterium]